MIMAVCRACAKLAIPVRPELQEMFARHAARSMFNGNMVEDPAMREDMQTLFYDDAFLEAIRRSNEYQLHSDAP
jgi:hypothetical protein